MLETIHILLVNVELGPFSEKQVREYLAAGHLQPSDLARFESNKEWAPLSDILTNLPQPIVQTPAPLAEAPPVGEFTPGPLTPAVVLFSPTAPTENEIKPPVENAVSYKKRRRSTRRLTMGDHWYSWGKYAAVGLSILLILVGVNWSSEKPTWSEFSLAVSRTVDGIIARFTR